ncbi:hypothetical protein [Caballeronia sp. DA-9]|uniref:hypothetical protein n=1 Tax=Caballeronia sp. DA-9 TaxID=3436237 RepID=UPI003F66B0A6
MAAYVFVGDWIFVGLVNAGLLLFMPSHVPCSLISLALLATVRGGTSFLFPTAKKKRSKENAFQPPILKETKRAVSSAWDFKRTLDAITTNT